MNLTSIVLNAILHLMVYIMNKPLWGIRLCMDMCACFFSFYLLTIDDSWRLIHNFYCCSMIRRNTKGIHVFSSFKLQGLCSLTGESEHDGLVSRYDDTSCAYLFLVNYIQVSEIVCGNAFTVWNFDNQISELLNYQRGYFDPWIVNNKKSRSKICLLKL